MYFSEKSPKWRKRHEKGIKRAKKTKKKGKKA